MEVHRRRYHQGLRRAYGGGYAEDRPRKKLGYATPEELFDSFLDRVYAVDSKPA